MSSASSPNHLGIDDISELKGLESFPEPKPCYGGLANSIDAFHSTFSTLYPDSENSIHIIYGGKKLKISRGTNWFRTYLLGDDGKSIGYIDIESHDDQLRVSIDGKRLESNDERVSRVLKMVMTYMIGGSIESTKSRVQDLAA